MSYILNPTTQVMLDELAKLVVAEDVELALPLLNRLSGARGEGECFACGVAGFGLSSWRFRLLVRTKRLHFNVTLPCWRVLADQAARTRDAKNIEVVCRFALAMLGAESFPGEGERFELEGRESGACSWLLRSADGKVAKSGADWGGAVDLVGKVDAGTESEAMAVDQGMFFLRP